MELIKDAYFGKSFMMIGDELPHCLNCSYCRANDGNGLHFHTMPTEINKNFAHIPVAINCFYGDPMLQVENTANLIDKLWQSGHQGNKIIISKGDLTKLSNYNFRSANMYIGVSTFGYCQGNSIDGGTWERFKDNLQFLHENKRGKFHIEFRPIINGINDKEENILPVMSLARMYNVPVAYSGLQVSENLANRLKEKGVEFFPYDERGFGLKKFISKEVEDRIKSLAKQCNVETFKKTSCLISSMDNTFDYNAHYYRPNEVGCYNCKNSVNCKQIKDLHDSQFLFNDYDYSDIIPFKHKVSYVEDHKCSLFTSGLCKFPTNDCTHINGRLIEIDEEITTTDVRLIKWLTGFTVKAKFVELPYISEKWRM